MGKNIIEFLCNVDELNKKYVWCIKLNSKIANSINEDTSTREIQKITLFTCAAKDILKNKEVKKILDNVKVIGFEEEGNDLFVFADCKNHQLIKSQLNSQGIY